MVCRNVAAREISDHWMLPEQSKEFPRFLDVLLLRKRLTFYHHKGGFKEKNSRLINVS